MLKHEKIGIGFGFHLAVACDVYDDVFLCCPFSHEKLLFTWLSLVVSMMMSFCVVLFPTRCLG